MTNKVAKKLQGSGFTQFYIYPQKNKPDTQGIGFIIFLNEQFN